MRTYKVTTKNGLVLDAIFIRDLPHINCVLFYLQDRLLMTDMSFNEIKSLDVVRFVNTTADVLKLSIDNDKMMSNIVDWKEL